MSEKAPDVQDEPLIGAEPAAGEDTPPAEPEKKAGKAGREQRKADEELERLREENRQLQQSERFWQQKAAGRTDGDDEPEPEPDDLDVSDLVGEGESEGEPDKEQTPDEFIDELGKHGPKAILKAVEKLGFVRKDDVAKLTQEIARRVVERERTKMSHDAELVARFPDLRDEQSELYQETRKLFREAVAKDPRAKNSPATLLLAAQAAQASLGGSRRSRGTDYDDYREQREDEYERDRRRRVDAQQGERGRGRTGDYEDDDLGPEARQIVSAFGVDEKAYRTERSKERKRR